MLNIKPTDLVLEIGSGNRPRRRSDVLCDKFIEDNTQRSSQEGVVIDTRPFVVADGMRLPFKDRSFDYVITSHILEHVEDPRRFVAELARVARSGYIETPSELGEKVFGWPFHKWQVRREANTIILRPRTEDSPFGDFFHRMYDQDLLFAEYMDSHYDDYYVRVEWREQVSLRVEDDTSPAVKFNSPGGTVQSASRMKELTIKLTRGILWPFMMLLRHFRKFDR